MVKRDCRSWGFNSIAYHTKVPLDLLKDEMYVMERIRMVRLETYNVPVARPDVFSDEFEESLDAFICGICMKWKDEEHLLGYAYSDTAEWAIGEGPFLAHSYRPVPVINPWVSALVSKGRTAPAKKKWLEILISRYHYAERAAAVYGIHADSWKDLGDATGWDNPANRECAAIDNARMLEAIAERWFSLHEKFVRKNDPRHLILGEKLNGNLPIPDFLLPVLKKYVDVVNIQWYGRYEEQVDSLVRVHEATGKPILMGDSAFAVVQPNQDSSKGVIVSTQEEVGREYETYLEKIMKLPFVVGWHHCGYMEGWKGLEKYEVDNPYTVTNPLCSTQCGFKDPFEDVHEETIRHLIRANASAHSNHEKSAQHRVQK